MEILPREQRVEALLQQRFDWTARQRDVFDLLARDSSNAQIANALGISLDGAKWHMREILSKLGVESREEAAEYWRRARRASPGQLLRFGLLSGAMKWTIAAAIVGASAIGSAAATNGWLQGSDSTIQSSDVPDLGSPADVTVLVFIPDPELGSVHYLIDAQREPLKNRVFDWVDRARVVGPVNERLMNASVLRLKGDGWFSISQAADCSQSSHGGGCVSPEKIVLTTGQGEWRLESPDAAECLEGGWRMAFSYPVVP